MNTRDLNSGPHACTVNIWAISQILNLLYLKERKKKNKKQKRPSDYVWNSSKPCRDSPHYFTVRPFTDLPRVMSFSTWLTSKPKHDLYRLCWPYPRLKHKRRESTEYLILYSCRSVYRGSPQIQSGFVCFVWGVLGINARPWTSRQELYLKYLLDEQHLCSDLLTEKTK